MPAPFARLPAPPYYAVIFSSQRTGDDEAGYAEAADRMMRLASQQPGFLGAEHAATRAEGRRRWYAHFELRVARVERAYGLKESSFA